VGKVRTTYKSCCTIQKNISIKKLYIAKPTIFMGHTKQEQRNQEYSLGIPLDG
jgi:hypothetical protein